MRGDGRETGMNRGEGWTEGKTFIVIHVLILILIR